MREARKRPWRLALLAFVVLAVHLWFLAGMPRLTMPEKNGATWTARTVTPPPAPPPPAPPSIEPAAKKPPAAVAPPIVAPRKPEAVPQPQRPPAIASTPASAASVAERTPSRAREPASSTREAGSSPALRFAVPSSAHFNYDVVAHTKGISLSGNARLDWRNDGREYEAQLTLSAPFLRSRTQRSTGLVTAQGLAPLRLRAKQAGRCS